MPSTLGQALIFVLLGLPGIAWFACRERRLPHWPKSLLRETLEFIAVSEVISASEVSVFEVGEYQGCFGYGADLVWAGGHVVKGAPALGEEGEAAFAEAAQRS